MASVCNWDRVSRKRRQQAHGLQKVACVICGETFETFHQSLIQRAKYCGPECRRESARRSAKEKRGQARAVQKAAGWVPNSVRAPVASVPGAGAACAVCSLPVGTWDKRVCYCSADCRKQSVRAQNTRRAAKWQRRNPEAKRLIQRRWKKAHPERVRADALRHYAAHAERLRDQRRERQAALRQSALTAVVQSRLAGLRDAVAQKSAKEMA